MTNLLLRLFGFGKAIDALDGEESKTYAAGAQALLLGLGGMIGGVVGLLGEFIAAKGATAYLAIVQNAGHDPYVKAVVAGWGAILAAKAVIAQRHATAKLSNALDEAQAQAPANAPAPVPAAAPDSGSAKPA